MTVVVTDGPTLRRLALLVMRAGDDDETLRRPSGEILLLIDLLKHDISRGLPVRHDDVLRLCSLIEKLVRRRSSSARPVEKAMLAELRDVGRSLADH